MYVEHLNSLIKVNEEDEKIKSKEDHTWAHVLLNLAAVLKTLNTWMKILFDLNFSYVDLSWIEDSHVASWDCVEFIDQVSDEWNIH